MQTVILADACTYYNLKNITRMSVGLFITITGLGRKNWRGGFSLYIKPQYTSTFPALFLIITK